MAKKTQSKQDTQVDEVIEVGLFDLINLGIEGLNDLAEEQIDKGILSDLSYKVVGHKGNTLRIRVYAELEIEEED